MQINSGNKVCSMKHDYREISSENPKHEIWSRLKRFYDPSIGTKHIRERLSNKIFKKHEQNILKQAKQAAATIRQAAEYFSAAEHVTISTRPVLLYYGTVSLGRAISLLNLDGKCSYDYLRKQNRHNHHGLELERNIKNITKTTGNLQEILDTLRCHVYIKDPEEVPWGHFAVVWPALSPDLVIIHKWIIVKGSGHTFEGFEIIKSYDQTPIDALKKLSFSCFELMVQIPELFDIFREYRCSTRLWRGKMQASETRHVGIRVQGKVTEKITDRRYTFWIFDINEDDYAYLCNELKHKNPQIKLWQPYENMVEGSLSETWNIDERPSSWVPDVIQSINSSIFFLKKDYLRIPLFGIHHIVLFMFSMAARYFPDLWVPLATENPGLTELFNYYFNSVTRVLPNLALDEIHATKYNFSP